MDYTGIEEIDREDSVGILGGHKIHVAQPTAASTEGFSGDDWHPICTVYCSTVFKVWLLLLLQST